LSRRALGFIATGALGFGLLAAGLATNASAAAPPDTCLRAALGERAYAEIFVERSRPPTGAENGKIGACYAQGGPEEGSSGSPAAAPDACLRTALGKRAYAEIFVQRSRSAAAAEKRKIAACYGQSGESGTTRSGRPSTTTPSTGTGCPSVSSLLARITGQDLRIPSSAELSCNAKRVKRLAPAAFAAGTGLDMELEDRSDYASWGRSRQAAARVIALRDALPGLGFPADLSPQTQNHLPPWLDSRGQLIQHPFPLAPLDQAARVYATIVLREKASGRRVLFNIPSAPVQPLFPKTLDEYRAWLTSYWVPRVTALAKTAELVKAEYFDPFTPEADIFFNHEIFRSLSNAERLALAQQFVDETRQAAVPYYKGILVGRQGWQFHDVDPAAVQGFWGGGFMRDLSFKGYGLLGVTLLPVRYVNCTVEYARAYLRAQLPKVVAMAARDRIPWGVLELDVFTFGRVAQYTSCGADPAQVWKPIYEELGAQLLGLTSRPSVVFFFSGPAEWSADRALVAAHAALIAQLAASLRG